MPLCPVVCWRVREEELEDWPCRRDAFQPLAGKPTIVIVGPCASGRNEPRRGAGEIRGIPVHLWWEHSSIRISESVGCPEVALAIELPTLRALVDTSLAGAVGRGSAAKAG